MILVLKIKKHDSSKHKMGVWVHEFTQKKLNIQSIQLHLTYW